MKQARIRAVIAAALVLGCAACAAPEQKTQQLDATGVAALATPSASSTSTATAEPSEAPPTATPTTSPATPPAGEPTATGTPTRPADPTAPAAITPVIRESAKNTTKLDAVAQPVTGTVTYADGVKARIPSLSTATVEGQGPGVLAGMKVTLASIEVTNGSTKPLDLTRVVVSGRYGSPARVAAVSYVPQSLDFTGIVAPGASAKAVYAVTFPKGLGRGDSLVIDLDAGHRPAVFTGPAR